MKHAILLACLCGSTAAFNAAAQQSSSVTLSGGIQVAVARGNGGSTPIDGLSGNKWALNDQSSVIEISGKEDLGGGLYAGFQLRSFVSVDTGASSTPLWASRSVVKLGGSFGELYAGRSFTPAAWMVLFADPWYWDGSAAQVGWQIQQANYTSTAYLRTDNTVGYTSPSFGGLSFHLAGSAGERAKGEDLGAAVNYKQGALWLGLGYDQGRGFDGTGPKDHLYVAAGAYDFGVVRPMFTYAKSKVNHVDYDAYSVAATVPVGASGVFKAAYASLSDWNMATVDEERLNKVSLGYQHALSKRTNLFANLSSAKGRTATATRTAELGIGHAF
jgi:predicted porin